MRTILLDDFAPIAILVWACLLFTILGDLFARADLGVGKKTLWAVVVLAVPMGAFAYMAVQSRAITDRKAARLLPNRATQSASTPDVADELAEEDRLVPMIQHAIEIKRILEAEQPATMMTAPDQIEICDETANEKPAYAR